MERGAETRGFGVLSWKLLRLSALHGGEAIFPGQDAVHSWTRDTLGVLRSTVLRICGVDTERKGVSVLQVAPWDSGALGV